MTDGEEWQKQVRAQAAELDPIGELGLPPLAADSAATAKTKDAELAKRFPSPSLVREVKALLKEDNDFLGKLDEYATMPDSALCEQGRQWLDQMASERNLAISHLAAERKIFKEHLPYFYEVKMRLLNKKYRPDLAPPDGRSPEDNLKNFGAADWADFRVKYVAYSLSQADQLLADWKAGTKRLEVGEFGLGPVDAAAGGNAAATRGETTTASGGKGGKELDAKAVSQAHRAEIADKLIGLLNNAPKDASAEQILKTAQATAQHEFEALSEQEQKKCKPVKIVVPNTVERLGIQIAKIVVTLGDPESAKAREAVALSFDLLRAAGIAKVGKIEVPAKPEAAEAPNGKKAPSAAAAKSEESKKAS